MRAIVLLLLAACATEPPPITPDPAPQVIVGRHVSFTAPADRTICGGTVAWLDDAAEAQAGALGLTVTGRIRYQWEPDLDALGCPPGAGGCTDETRGRVQALYPDMAHELVHAVLGLNGFRAPSFLDEGTAVALGGDEGGGGVIDDGAVGALLGDAPIPGGGYATAGDLASYLLDTRGPAPWLALLRATRWGEGAADVRAAFAAAYGESLDDVLAARALDPHVYEASRLDVPACLMPAAAWDGGVAHASIDVDCATGVGPHPSALIGAPDTARRWVTFDIPADGDYQIGAAGASGIVNVGACGGDFITSFGLPGTPPKIVHLRAGRIHADLEADVGAPATIDVTIGKIAAGAGVVPSVPE